MFPFMAPAIIKSAAAILKPQDVFATSLWTGDDTNKVITTGVDMLSKGGLLWEKVRDQVLSHRLCDTARGAAVRLATDTTAAEVAGSGQSFRNNGFNASAWGSGSSVVGWSFARAAKFFDIVTWTGDGTSNRQIPHGLGVVPGMIIVKKRDTATNWIVTHRSLTQPNYDYLLFNTTGVSNSGDPSIFGTGTDATKFVVGSGNAVNTSGATYVAYLFAHDPSADGIVQCGSFTEQSGGTTVTLGWQPQFILFKTPNLSGDWYIQDTTRGWSVANLRIMYPDRPDSELAYSGTDYTKTTSTGFTFGTSTFFGAGTNVIYLAIRAPY